MNMRISKIEYDDKVIVCGDVNIITGYHQTGKTTILESIIKRHKNVPYKNFKNINVIIEDEDYITPIVSTLSKSTITQQYTNVINQDVIGMIAFTKADSSYNESGLYNTLMYVHNYILEHIENEDTHRTLVRFMQNRCNYDRFTPCINLIDIIEVSLHTLVQQIIVDVLEVLFPYDQFFITTYREAVYDKRRNSLTKLLYFYIR